MNDKISVYIYSETDNINHLKYIFDESFVLHSHKEEKEKYNLLDTIEESYQIEYHNIITILKKHKLEKTPGPCIILKESSETILGKKTLNTYLKQILKTNDYDIFYLTSWLDKCHMYREESLIGSLHIHRTFSVYGFQAVILKPKAIDTILSNISMKDHKYMKLDEDFQSLSLLLSKNIENGNLIAKVCNPNIFNFNTKYIKCDDDYLKLDKCQSVIEIKKTDMTLWYVLGGIVLILILILLILFLMQKKK